jgi:uncharacterized membrane protein
VIAGVLGIGYALVTPPFQFGDEHSHFARSYQIARGGFVGSGNPELPPGVMKVIAEYPEGYLHPRAALQFRIADLLARGSGDSMPPQPVGDVEGIPTFGHGIAAVQVYWSGCYLPAAAAIAVARWCDLSPVAMLYAARLAQLLVFLAALALALYLAPDFRALIIGVVLMPTTIQQAVTVGADSMTIACGIAGFAIILYTRDHPVSRRCLAALWAAVPFWVLCKNSLWAPLLLLLIPANQFRSRARQAAYLTSAAAMSVAALLVWKFITSAAMAHYAAVELSKGLDLYANMGSVITHPVQVGHDLFTQFDWVTYSGTLTKQFVATFDWNRYQLPLAAPYLAMLALTACLEGTAKPFTFGERVVLLMVFIIALVQIYAMLFVIDGMSAGGHYRFRYTGVQGRYFIPFCLAGFLAIKQNRISEPRVLKQLVLTASALYSALCLGAIGVFFYS